MHSSINKFKGIHIGKFHSKSQIDWLSLKLPWFFFNFLQPYSMFLGLLRNNTACVLAKILNKKKLTNKLFFKNYLFFTEWQLMACIPHSCSYRSCHWNVPYSNEICNHYLTVYYIQVTFLASNLLSNAFLIRNLYIQISCMFFIQNVVVFLKSVSAFSWKIEHNSKRHPSLIPA